MARPRSGSLELRPDGWHARLTVDLIKDGKPVSERRWIKLGTFDKGRAERMKAKLVRELEAGRLVAEAKEQATKPETAGEFATKLFERREREGVVMARDERTYWRKYMAPILNDLALIEIRGVHCQTVIDEAAAKGLAHGSLGHLKRLLTRVFKSARRAEIITGNPAEFVELPKRRGIRKERAILTDHEIAIFMACPDVDLELRIISLVARTEGGMRTGDINAWDWSMIDRVHFEQCVIPRAKTGAPQMLEIPEVLRSILQDWWTSKGCPEAGPVFPVRTGPARGGFKRRRGMSYALRLRRGLLRAGVKRHKCTRPSDAKTLKIDEPCCPAYSVDPLYSETATTRPVDFHSFRRAFNTALAEAGVNVQQAMHLAGHSDAKTHMRYVMQTDAMKRIPAAALPQLPPGVVIVLPRRVDDSVGPSNDVGAQVGDTTSDSQYARSDSNGRHSASKSAGRRAWRGRNPRVLGLPCPTRVPHRWVRGSGAVRRELGPGRGHRRLTVGARGLGLACGRLHHRRAEVGVPLSHAGRAVAKRAGDLFERPLPAPPPGDEARRARVPQIVNA